MASCDPDGAGTGAHEKKVFHAAGVVNPAIHYVVDRSKWHEELVDKLARGLFLLLHAHRQGGKSSAARAVGSLLMKRPFLVVSITMESSRPVDEPAMWTALANSMAAAMSALPAGSIPPDLLARITSGLLFHDSTTFEAMFDFVRWPATTRIILIVDEFDTLLEAPDSVRHALLASLRSLRTRNSIAPEASSSPSALYSVLGIGVYRLLQLATRVDEVHRHSPFNISDALSVPLTTLESVRQMLADFSADADHAIPDEVAADFHWRSGGHVGLLSLLGQQLVQLCSGLKLGEAVDTAQWFAVACGSSLQGTLRESATVASMLSMLRSGNASSQSSPVSQAARSILRDMLSAPEDTWFEIAGGDASRDDALAYLMTEGVVVADTNKGTAIHRIVAPIIVPLLLRDVGSRALVVRMPRLPFARHATGGINLMQTLMELLPYINVDALFHPYALLKRGAPCEYAYHFQLYDLLSHRAAEGGWRLLGESRNAKMPGHLRRLDLYIASNGHRCGIELLAEGDALIGHVYEQAPTYLTQQKLDSLLVVNFATIEAAVVPNVPRPLPAGVELLQVLVSRTAKTLTPYMLGGADGLTATARPPITEDVAGATDSLLSPFAALSTRSTRPKFVVCGGIVWPLADSTVGSMLELMVADLELGSLGQYFEMWLVRADAGASRQLGKSARAVDALPAAIFDGARLELRIRGAPQAWTVTLE